MIIIRPMISKLQLKEGKDENNRFTAILHVNWQETSLSRVYDAIDQQVEGGSLADIVSMKPIAFDPEKEQITVQVVLDVSDILEEQDDESEED